jgi:hypothetical protein
MASGPAQVPDGTTAVIKPRSRDDDLIQIHDRVTLFPKQHNEYEIYDNVQQNGVSNVPVPKPESKYKGDK